MGIDIDLIAGLDRPAVHRAEALYRLVEVFFSSPEQLAQLWQQVLGHLTSLEKLVPRGRLYMRPIQFCLSDQWTQHAGLPSSLVTTSHEARQALLWWTSPAHLRGIPFTLPDVDWRLFSYASTEGWGAHLLELRAEALWTQAQSTQHQQLELLAVDLALKQFLPTVRFSHVYTCLLTSSRRLQVVQTNWSSAPSVAARFGKLWEPSTQISSSTTRITSFRSTPSPLPDV